MRRLPRLLLLLGIASLTAANKKADILNKLAKEQQHDQDGEGVEAVIAENMTREDHRELSPALGSANGGFSVLVESLANPSLPETFTDPFVPETLMSPLATPCPSIDLKAPRTIRAGRQVLAGRHVYMVAKLTSNWDMEGGLRDGGLILTLPEGLEYVGAVISPMAPGYGIHPEVSGQTVAWTALDLAPGKSFKFRLELKVLPGGPAVRTLMVQATVDGSTCGRSATVELLVKPTEVYPDESFTQAPPPGITDESFTQVAGGGLAGLPEDSCLAADFDELKDAVENKACGKVYLVPGQIYVFKKEIFVRRHVVVIGNPTVPPKLDGEDLVRTWHVTDGGLLDLQFVQQLTSDGISPGSLPTISKPLEPQTPKTPIFANPPVVAPVVPGTTSVSLTQADADAIRNGIKGDPFQAIATSDANMNMKEFVGENSCWPADADELTDAIQNQDCELIVLSNGDPDAYALEADMQVTRHVRVVGNPAVLPQIDAGGAVRAFTVGPGGFLELQFVRVRRGGGETRDRYGYEGLELNTLVHEIRGGGVAVEPGALGASFVGVTFIAVANTPESVQNAIQSTLDFVGGRTYGGHVFVASGTVTFFGCNFWDTTILLPLTDQVTLGGDVLVVAGKAFFTGCTFTSILLFGKFGGVGFNVAVLGGNAVFTFCVLQAQSIAQPANGAGHVLFVGGGTLLVTGMDFRFVSPILFFTGIGKFFVGDGVMVFSGVNIESSYPILAAYGAGFYLAVGAGVMVETGVSYVQESGPAHQALTGATSFGGDGSSIHVGVPASIYGTTVHFTGQGGFSYNGGGHSLWLGSPIAIFLATSTFFGLGGLTSQPAGFAVHLGCPAFTPTALSYFAGLGVVLYLGAGAAVIGGSPVYAPAYKFTSSPTTGYNYYVNGNEEASGKGIGYFDKDTTDAYVPEEKGKSRVLSTEDNFHSEVRKLRAERRLSVSAVSDLTAAFFNEDSRVSSRFLGADLKVQPQLDFTNNEMVKQLESWVPQGILAGAKEIASMGNGGITERGTLLGMDSQDVDYCGFCGEGEVGGASAGQCTKFDSCKEFKTNAPEGTMMAFNPIEVQFDPWHIVIATFNPTSEAGQKVAPHDFRDALRTFFIANETHGVSVSAFAEEVDPLMKAMLPTLAGPRLSGLVNEAFRTSTQLKAVFVVNNAAKAQAIQAALGDRASEEYESMEMFVQDFLSLYGVNVGALDGAVEKVISIPAYNTPEFSTAFAKEASAAAGTNSVRLIDGEHTGLHLFHAAAGESYTVLLANFPKSMPLTLQLIGSQEVNGVSKQTATALSSLKTDKDGAASVTWEVPADQPLGDYYIKAADASGVIFGMTPMLELTGAPKRKLWGPHMTL